MRKTKFSGNSTAASIRHDQRGVQVETDPFCIEEIFSHQFGFLALFLLLFIISHFLPIRRLPARSDYQLSEVLFLNRLLPNWRSWKPGEGKKIVQKKMYILVWMDDSASSTPKNWKHIEHQETFHVFLSGVSTDQKANTPKPERQPVFIPVRIFCKWYQSTEAVSRRCSSLSKQRKGYWRARRTKWGMSTSSAQVQIVPMTTTPQSSQLFGFLINSSFVSILQFPELHIWIWCTHQNYSLLCDFPKKP